MNSTELTFEELETILVKEVDTHHRLFRTATQVNEALKQSDLSAIQERSSYLDSLVALIERLELQRSECCALLSRKCGIDRARIKLGALIEKAPPRFREKLSSLHGALKQIINRISTVNVSNSVLLEEGLELVRGRMSLIANPSERFTQYRQGGRMNTASSTSLHPFINQTV
ncbi:MAG: flagellar export chaperone FlgN [Chitinispirillaceae bacterium]|nr:flagellar export chaperone FlgN [Chitinispirillaceae bacterium]